MENFLKFNVMEDCIIIWTFIVIGSIIAVLALFSAPFYFKKCKNTLPDDAKKYDILATMSSNALKSIISLNGLVGLLMLSGIALTFYLIGSGTKDDVAIITGSLVFASIIPYIVGRSIAKNEIDKIVDEKFDARFQYLADKYNTSIASLRKNNAHTRRIIAQLLSDNYSKSDKGQDINDEIKYKCEWAIGWAAEGIISYLLIKDTYEKSHKYAEECGKIISALKDVEIEEGQNEKYSEIHDRTLGSILTLYALRNISHNPRFGEIKDEDLEGIITKLCKKISPNETELKKPLAIAEKCKISDLNDDNINKKIPQVATAYIQKLKSSNTSSTTN